MKTISNDVVIEAVLTCIVNNAAGMSDSDLSTLARRVIAAFQAADDALTGLASPDSPHNAR